MRQLSDFGLCIIVPNASNASVEKRGVWGLFKTYEFSARQKSVSCADGFNP